jgi:hypothetical protein
MLVGCVASHDRKLFSPDFEGGITPVTIPIQPKYMPCEYQYSDTTKLYGNDKKTNCPETTRTFGKIKIQKLEDNLLCTGTIDKMIIGGKTAQGSLPVMDMKLLITSYGTVLKKEIMFPLFAKNSELHDQLLADMDKFSFLLSYPENRIKRTP